MQTTKATVFVGISITYYLLAGITQYYKNDNSFAFSVSQRKDCKMIKIKAAPKWQLTSRSQPLRSRSSVPITVSTGSMTIAQTLLPRSLDLSFEFKYRR